MAFGSDITESIGNVGGRTTAQGYNSADEVRKQYTGYERDDESGLDFAQARYYNSNHGRFTSVDPLTASATVRNPQTFNRYSYVLNSPYKFVDPLGLISSSTIACGQECGNGMYGGGMISKYGNNGSTIQIGSGQTEGAGPRTEPAEPPPPPDMWLEYKVGSITWGELPPINGTPVGVERQAGIVRVELTAEQKKILADLWNNNFPQQLSNEIGKIRDEKFGTEDVVGKEKERGESSEQGAELGISKEPNLTVSTKQGADSKEKESIKVETGKTEKKDAFVDMATASANAITALQKTRVDFQTKPSDSLQLGVKRNMSFGEAESLVNRQNGIGQKQAQKLAEAATKEL